MQGRLSPCNEMLVAKCLTDILYVYLVCTQIYPFPGSLVIIRETFSDSFFQHCSVWKGATKIFCECFIKIKK